MYSITKQYQCETLLSRESETREQKHSWIGTREKTIKEKTKEERERR